MRVLLVACGIVWSVVACGDGVVMDGDVFTGSSKGGSEAVASLRLELCPQSSVCIHDDRDWVDFWPVFTPASTGPVLQPSMLEGFALNSNGTLRLSLGGDDSAYGYVTVGVPPLSWGELCAEASIHRCEGGVQEMCYACGRLHGSDADVVCSHASACEARYDRGAPCTCPPLFVKVNWDDDGFDWDEDRNEDSPSADDDELVEYRALGVSRSCWCHTGEEDGSHLSGLTASSELRLWGATNPAVSSASVLKIEAVGATAGIGTGSFQYDVYDVTNGLLRTVVRQVTAANAEIRPDWDDNGVIDWSDRSLLQPEARPGRWQLRVRETPYCLQLANEVPSEMAVSFGSVCTSGTSPAIHASMTGLPVVPEKNSLQGVYIDTSAGEGDVTLTYVLGLSAGETNIVDSLDVHVVDTTVEEKWIPAGPDSNVEYDYSSVDGDVYWSVWRETEDGAECIDGGYGPCFALQGLAAGDYHVEVYFAGIFEDGYWGYTSYGDFHVVDVRLARLYETSNPANRIFNPTRKDDTSGNFIGEKEHAGTPNEERYAVPRNYLYVVGATDTGDLNVTAEFTGTGVEACTNYYCAFYGERNDKIPNSETNIDFTAESVAFSLHVPDVITNVLYQLRGGLDLNGNGSLDDDEASAFVVYTNSERRLKKAYVKGISKRKYANDCEAKEGEVFFATDNPASAILPHARTMLTLFYENGSLAHLNPVLMPDVDLTERVQFDAFSTNCSSFAEWLTHNCGHNFDDAGLSIVTKYVWTARSNMSEFLAMRTPFALTIEPRESSLFIDESMPSPTGERVWQFYNDNVKAVAEAMLAEADDGQEVVLPSTEAGYDGSAVFYNLSSNWVPGITLVVGGQSGYANGYDILPRDVIANTDEWDEFDAFGTIGRGRVENPQYRFRIKKEVGLLGLVTRYKVVEVRFSCKLTDLYDFNYEDGGRATAAATLQIGYGNGTSSGYSRHGKIFMHEILIDFSYENPFRYYGREL